MFCNCIMMCKIGVSDFEVLKGSLNYWYVIVLEMKKTPDRVSGHKYLNINVNKVVT